MTYAFESGSFPTPVMYELSNEELLAVSGGTWGYSSNRNSNNRISQAVGGNGGSANGGSANGGIAVSASLLSRGNTSSSANGGSANGGNGGSAFAYS